MDTMEVSLTANEVATLLRVPRARVYEMSRNEERFFGNGGVVLRIGRQVRFNRAAFQNWLERGGSVQPFQTEADRAA